MNKSPFPKKTPRRRPIKEFFGRRAKNYFSSFIDLLSSLCKLFLYNKENNKPRRTIDEFEFDILHERHGKWLELPDHERHDKHPWRIRIQNAEIRTRGKPGSNLQEAIFEDVVFINPYCKESGVNFEGTNLCRAILRKSDLRGANLRKTNLKKVDLREALLNNATLEESYLEGAWMQCSEMFGSNLTGASGIKTVYFSGANIHGVIYCRDGAEEDLPGIKEKFEYLIGPMRLARTIFTTQMVVASYVLVAISSVSDTDIISGDMQFRLPFFSGNIETFWFFIISPFVVSFFFITFHIYFLRAWENLARLPAVLQDGTSLLSITFPWLAQGLFLSFSERKKRQIRPVIHIVEPTLAAFLLWFISPITIALLGFRSLPVQHWHGSILQIGVLAITCSISLSFFFRLRRAFSLFQIRQTFQGTQNSFWTDLHSDTVRAFSASLIGLTLLLITQKIFDDPGPYFRAIQKNETNRAIFSPLCHKHHYFLLKEIRNISSLFDILSNTNVHELFSKLGITVHADIHDSNLSFQQRISISNFNQTRPFSLSGRNLRYIRASRAIFNYAILTGSDLRGADLLLAKMRHSNLQDTCLDGAILDHADLTGALLNAVIVRKNWGRVHYREEVDKILETKFECANSRHKPLENESSRIVCTSLRGTSLKRTKLNKAKMISVNMSHAYLFKTEMDQADLSFAIFSESTFNEVLLTNATLTETIFGTMEWNKVNAANSIFNYTNLEGTEINQSNFKGADMRLTKLNGTKFTNVDAAGSRFSILTDWRNSTFSDVTFDVSLKANKERLQQYKPGIYSFAIDTHPWPATPQTEEQLSVRSSTSSDNKNLKNRRTDFDGSYISKATMKNVNFSSSNLTNTFWDQTKLLEHIFFFDANLKNADLSGAIIEESTKLHFEGADLTNAKLPTKITKEQVTGITCQNAPDLSRHNFLFDLCPSNNKNSLETGHQHKKPSKKGHRGATGLHFIDKTSI